MNEFREQRTSMGPTVAGACKGHAWRCWVEGCGLLARWSDEEADSVGFVLVHHLIKHHGMLPAEVIAADASLASEVGGYCKAMGLGTPVEVRTGVPATTGIAGVKP